MPGPGVQWDLPAPIWLAWTATSAGMLAGFLLKLQCVVHLWADFFQYRRLCYSDIQALWVIRGIRDGLLPYRDVQMEYPVLTGLFMDLSGRVLRLIASSSDSVSHGDYFLVSTALLAPFGFAVTTLIRPHVSARRLMVWAAGSPIILYGFMNWDLPAVAAGTWALAAFLRKRYWWAGVAAAIGASAKLYPVFFVPVMVLAVLARRETKSAIRLVLGFVAAYAACNVPWILISGGHPRIPPGVGPEVSIRQPGTNGWMGVWRFHMERGAEFDTVWFWMAEASEAFSAVRRPPFISWGTLALFFGISAASLWRGWQRRQEPAGFPALTVILGILCAFLVTSKIYSPQYGLWLAPLLALVSVPWPPVTVFLAGDLLVFVSRFFFYTTGADVNSGWAVSFQTGVWVRAAALLWMIRWALLARRVEPRELRN